MHIFIIYKINYLPEKKLLSKFIRCNDDEAPMLLGIVPVKDIELTCK